MKQIVKQIKKSQLGFTLIEMVTVIAVTAVLAATVTQKVTTVNADARGAALNSVAGVLGSAGSSNQAAHGSNSANGIAVRNCSTTTNLLQVPLVTGEDAVYAITAQVVARDETVSCVLSTVSTPVLSTTYLGYGIGDEAP
ncbi:MAG: prepilin-type N-terminal cleavage/methylation domain-containing protein [Halioglobus sp.]|jgi:prepilin-type N-terminal cleavage/methylation domain-containing protein